MSERTSSRPPDRGFFVYPWDLLDEGVESIVRALREDYLCNVIGLNCSYHSGRFFHPHHSRGGTLPYFRGKINHRWGGAVSFRPNPDLYEGAPLPPVEEPLAEADVIGRVRNVCRQIEMGFNLWTVVLHNSTLGSAHPELCQRNVFGDVFRFGLCPANPTARRYARALVEDVCQQYGPDWLMLESPTYLGFVHGDHHELIMANLDETAQMLLGLCFCDACREGAAAHGCDVEIVAEQVRSLAETLIEDERGALSSEFRYAEPASLLLNFPQIDRYVRYRFQVVSSLLAELKAIGDRYGARTGVTTSIFTRPAARAWMEGTSLRQAAQHVDALLTVSYFPDPEEVRADIRLVKMMIGDRPFNVALDAGHPDALSEANLVTKAQIAAAEGAGAIFYYNYGLLTRRRLDWVRSANRAVQAG